jgi:hypothetical protein
MQRIYDLAADYRVPVLMHWQHQRFNYGFERFHKVLAKHHRTRFIGHAQTWWAHLDASYRDDASNLYPKGPITPGGLTDRYLSDYSNMYGDLSAGSGLNALTRDEEHARAFLERQSQISIPVQFEIEGARSEMTVEMEGTDFDLKDHRIPLERSHERGWGRVSIPADANPADNEFYFVFDKPAPRKTIVVADDAQGARPLELAAAISPDPAIPCTVEVVPADQLGPVEWDKISLVLWEAPLPEGEAAMLLRTFVERGGQVVFFPPHAPGSADFLGVRWETWTESQEEIPVESWRGDQDLLSQTQSGAALPVGGLQVRRFCSVAGESTVLASLKEGKPLLVRAPTPGGGAYFCATTPAPGDSSLATGGVVLYVLIQRALAEGAAVLGNTRQLVAGAPPEDDPATWQRVTGDERAISTEFPFHRGVYLAGDRLLAVNRPAAEDRALVLADHRLGELFQGLDFARVDDQASSLSSLIQEVWRLFLAAMIVALIVEAGLCLPKLARARETTFKTEPQGFQT